MKREEVQGVQRKEKGGKIGVMDTACGETSGC